MNFPDAIESGLKKWITFSGRAPRSEYWFYVLFFWIFYIFEHCARKQLDMLDGHPLPLWASLLSLAALMILFVCLMWVQIGMISVFVRRMHDTNHSGWWYWIFLTIVGIIFPLLVWKCTEGTKGDNRYGPDPLQKVAS